MDDFDLGGPIAPKQGRRAGRRGGPPTTELTLTDDGDTTTAAPSTLTLDSNFTKSEAPSMPDFSVDPNPATGAAGDDAGPPAARSGAFSLEDTTSESAESKKFLGISRRKQEQADKDEDEKVGRKKKYDEVESIVDIPEVDEAGEDITRVIAEAPKIRSQKVQAINELQDTMAFNLPASDDRDIDLSLLTAVLCSIEQIQEGDELWDADQLFTDVASELNAEREKAEGGPPPSNEPIDDMNAPMT